MNAYTLVFQEIDRTMRAVVGGKGANLGELSRINLVQVPAGLCVTTEAYIAVVGSNELLNGLLDKLSVLKADDRKAIAEAGAEIRQMIEAIPIPKSISDEVAKHLQQLGETGAYAVRSSATAEDLPNASFAGQQDTYLNIIGKEAILAHISKCWASLYTDRAIIYRQQNGYGHKKVYLSVVIQKMIFPHAAGILFTADPVNGSRKVLSIDAGFGLGEAMVSGLVNADVYKVSDGEIIDKKISTKKLAIYASKDGGTVEQKIQAEQQNTQALRDEQILQLEKIGRTVERHFGSPQDIEWCLADDEFYIVQSRPITTLFPIPEQADGENHVYISVGHQQMMTDAIKPLGLSLWQLTTLRPMYTAGGRLFVDVASSLASVSGRGMLMGMLGRSDPLIKRALLTIIGRNFIKEVPEDSSKVMPALIPQAPIDNDPVLVTQLIADNEVSVELLKQNIQTKTGAALFDFIREDIKELKRLLFNPGSSAIIMAAINTAARLNEKMEEWLGEKNAADKLTRSVPHNITSEMGLALMDVADVIRPYPDVVGYLQQVTGDDFLEGLLRFNGGQQIRDAIKAYLDKYGMRCAGEIDITKTRWSENPKALIPIILTNIKSFKPGAAALKFEQGRKEALGKKEELLHRLKQLPDGEEKAADAKQMIELLRGFMGYREYPKYGMISRYFQYKQALMKEAEQLLQARLIRQKDDIYYLSFDELCEVVSTYQLDYGIIDKRRAEHKMNGKLQPPRVITSDGEIITGAYEHENLPDGAIVGLAVSTGVIEGRARVILNMEDAHIEEGDILVTTFTDPSWTPLFVSIAGLVTEVGGLMTHGAVIAREYGLPAVVGVEQATKLIKDGQRIRVNGTDGFVEIL